MLCRVFGGCGGRRPFRASPPTPPSSLCAWGPSPSWVGLDYRRAGAGAQFEPVAVAIIALYALAVLAVAFALSRSTRPNTDFRSVLAALVVLLPVIIGAGFLIDLRWSGAAAGIAFALLGLYGIAYLEQTPCARSPAPFRSAPFWGCCVPGAAPYLLSRFGDLSRAVDTWPAAADAEDDGDMSALMAESLLFDQRAQIDDAVDAMRPAFGASPVVYFVGFAGVAEQRVFAEEIKLAARVVDEAFRDIRPPAPPDQ